MKISKVYKHLCLWAASLNLLFLFALPAQSQSVVFTIDPGRSQFVTSGNYAGAVFSGQGAGALTASLSGTLNAQLGNLTIQFTGGSNITANASGNWQPLGYGAPGSAPASFGTMATVPVNVSEANVLAAARDVAFDLTSVSLPLTGDNFNCGGSYLDITSIENDFVATYTNGAPYKNGALTNYSNGYVANNVTTPGSLTSFNGVQTVMIPINARFYFKLLQDDDSTVAFAGQIVATRNLYGTLSAPIIDSIVRNGQNLVITTQNTTAQSKLFISTGLASWSLAANVTVAANIAGTVVFTVPISGPREFYRVQQ